jgi:hypothetical protein
MKALSKKKSFSQTFGHNQKTKFQNCLNATLPAAIVVESKVVKKKKEKKRISCTVRMVSDG